MAWASLVALVVKNMPANAGDIADVSLIPGLGRSPEGGHGNLLQYHCLENSMHEEPGELLSIRPRVRHDRSDLPHRHTSPINGYMIKQDSQIHFISTY